MDNNTCFAIKNADIRNSNCTLQTNTKKVEREKIRELRERGKKEGNERIVQQLQMLEKQQRYEPPNTVQVGQSYHQEEYNQLCNVDFARSALAELRLDINHVIGEYMFNYKGPVHIYHIGGDSYVEVYERAIPASKEIFDAAWAKSNEAQNEIYGTSSPNRRVQAFYSIDPAVDGYYFAGQVAERVGSAKDYPGFRHFHNIFGTNFNGMLVNYYGPNSVIGKHADNLFGLASSNILTLSWYDESGIPERLRGSRDPKSGVPYRRFRLVPNPDVDPKLCKNSKLVSETINLFNGDIAIMRGNCQKTHLHEIMPARKYMPDWAKEPVTATTTAGGETDFNTVPNICELNNRISLTFRLHKCN